MPSPLGSGRTPVASSPDEVRRDSIAGALRDQDAVEHVSGDHVHRAQVRAADQVLVAGHDDPGEVVRLRGIPEAVGADVAALDRVAVAVQLDPRPEPSDLRLADVASVRPGEEHQPGEAGTAAAQAQRRDIAGAPPGPGSRVDEQRTLDDRQLRRRRDRLIELEHDVVHGCRRVRGENRLTQRAMPVIARPIVDIVWAGHGERGGRGARGPGQHADRDGCEERRKQAVSHAVADARRAENTPAPTELGHSVVRLTGEASARS